jgi:5-methylcytosine-specific restriction endonuclease McrA
MEVISKKQAQEQGLKRYFTGKPCKRGHVSERYVSGGVCIECDNNRVRSKEYVEYQKKYNRTWQQVNRDKINAQSRERYSKNPEKYREKKRDWLQRHKGYATEYLRKWRADNPEYMKEWRQRNLTHNRGLEAKKEAKRRAIKRGWEANWTPTQKLEVDIIYAEAAILGPNFEVDHIIPLSKGGSHTADNLQIITKAHHAPKGVNIWQDRKYI